MRRVGYLTIVVTLVLGLTAPAAVAGPEVFHTTLSGAEEVPARDTPARGAAFLATNRAETRLGYVIFVSRIENVVAAHIHCEGPGANGPVGVTLFMGAPGGGPEFGILAADVVTAPDAGNACGWDDVGEVVAAIRTGDTYINVHTSDGVDPPNTGPGDFPGGEIRGQL
jgi:hypothetical protein